jgi:hypothetical protein
MWKARCWPARIARFGRSRCRANNSIDAPTDLPQDPVLVWKWSVQALSAGPSALVVDGAEQEERRNSQGSPEVARPGLEPGHTIFSRAGLLLSLAALQGVSSFRACLASPHFPGFCVRFPGVTADDGPRRPFHRAELPDPSYRTQVSASPTCSRVSAPGPANASSSSPRRREGLIARRTPPHGRRYLVAGISTPRLAPVPRPRRSSRSSKRPLPSPKHAPDDKAHRDGCGPE